MSWCASCNCTDPSQEDVAALGRVGQSSVAGPSDTTCKSLGPAHPRRDCGNRPVPGREQHSHQRPRTSDLLAAATRRHGLGGRQAHDGDVRARPPRGLAAHAVPGNSWPSAGNGWPWSSATPRHVSPSRTIDRTTPTPSPVRSSLSVGVEDCSLTQWNEMLTLRDPAG